MPTPKLPKAVQAIIASHEAGQHDKAAKEGCRSCAAIVAAGTCAECFEAIATQGDVDAHASRHRSGTDTIIMNARPAAKPAPKVKRLAEPGPVIDVTDVVVKVAKPKRVNAKPVVIAKPPEASILGAIVVPEGGYRTREEWMLAAVEAFRPWFADEGETLPPVRISIGWPGGRGPKKNVLGQCFPASAVDDAIPALFVTPSQKDPVEVLETILHECIHAAGHMHHRSPFQKVARKFGFTNGARVKTSRKDSPDLYATLDEMAAALGPFPHGAVNGGGGGDDKAPPVQGTRMLKVWCEEDGYTMRATAKWLKIAVPACPMCEDVMQVEWKGEAK
jgi:hypothetical protein